VIRWPGTSDSRKRWAMAEPRVTLGEEQSVAEQGTGQLHAGTLDEVPAPGHVKLLDGVRVVDQQDATREFRNNPVATAPGTALWYGSRRSFSYGSNLPILTAPSVLVLPSILLLGDVRAMNSTLTAATCHGAAHFVVTTGTHNHCSTPFSRMSRRHDPIECGENCVRVPAVAGRRSLRRMQTVTKGLGNLRLRGFRQALAANVVDRV
jgi:hypothetical protein